MKKIWLIYALCLAFGLLASQTSQASLLSYQNHTYNSDSNTITGNGLEWIRWDATTGLSYDSALTSIANGSINGVDYGSGWRIATNTDMAALYSVFFPQIVWDTIETTSQSIDIDFIQGDDPAFSNAIQFIELFGFTRFRPSPDPDSDDGRFSISAIFGDNPNANSPANAAFIGDDYTSLRTFDGQGNPVYRNNPGLVRLADGFYDRDEFSSRHAVALVRELHLVNANTPSMLLAAFALLILVGRKRF